jgi:hypothetical protein
MNFYLKIKDTLTEDKKYRNSYKELIWRIWEDEGSIVNGCLTKTQFMNATLPEDIRRTAQKCVANHPELDADPGVREKRKEVEKTGGNFVFNNSKKDHSPEWLKDAMKVLVRKWQGQPKEGEDYEKDKVLYKRYEQMLKDDPVSKFEKDLLST